MSRHRYSGECPVVTWDTITGGRESLCTRHEDARPDSDQPKLVQVYHGQHIGRCDECRREREEFGEEY